MYIQSFHLEKEGPAVTHGVRRAIFLLAALNALRRNLAERQVHVAACGRPRLSAAHPGAGTDGTTVWREQVGVGHRHETSEQTGEREPFAPGGTQAIDMP
jgi:hypothetical protein